MTERPPFFSSFVSGHAAERRGCDDPCCDEAAGRRDAHEDTPRFRDVALRLRPSSEPPAMPLPGRDATLTGLLGPAAEAARRLRVIYSLRHKHPLEVSLSVTVPLGRDETGERSRPPLTRRGLEILSRAALPGFAPVAPRGAPLTGPEIPLRPLRRDVFAPLAGSAGRPTPRPVMSELLRRLFLPPADAPALALDQALIGLAEAGAEMDLILDITTAPLDADALRMLGEAQQRLLAATHAAGMSNRTSAALAQVERWMRAEGSILQIDTAVCCAGRTDPTAVHLAETLLFGAELNDTGDTGPVIDLSRAVLPGVRAPALMVHPRAVAAIAGLAEQRRPRPPRGTGLSLGVDELDRDVAVPADDLRQHAYVVGQTGTGKSTLLKRLALADAEAGVPQVVIDPHGDLHAELIAALPPHVMKRAIIADVGDFDTPFSLNILEVEGPHAAIQRNFIANQLIALFKIVYGANQEAFGPIFEQFFRSSLFLLMDAGGPETSLLDLERVFGDAAFRRGLLEKCEDPQVVSFWKNIALKAGGDISLQNVAPYITSKLAQIAGNPLVRPIVCTPRTTLDLPAALAEGRTVLVNLAKGLVGGPDAAMIGGIVTIRLFAAAMARARLPVAERPLTRVMLDEFHTFGAHGILSEAMAEVRKYGISLVLANQSVAQIDRRGSDVAHAILGNSGNLFAFRVGPKDATTLAEWLGPEVAPQTLMRLPNHTCIARTLQNGVPLPPRLLRQRRSSDYVPRRRSAQ
ncbi:type IV secretory system conjugative DNA transfer family protein [Roseovarius sp.]|uniref:type IV secretory system conjugative DNA transfer family protein n=1 Tax=Roseovarius sp. TaxID=1486281 RepID=UPI003568490E